ncbi:transglutaminase domain-containing protein [Ancylomarina sp. 16SWW S1-10-2]|uniref:transglutaminase domain-containing protein n=1 Tax=Ancylomarina sp. 16SWW S1-10-2 TaxID=2499681 RepID=UPI001E4C7150|nr:transglutaminase domain-containing protein [Ancylomarina sp. 16SWW S1-10-2]
MLLLIATVLISCSKVPERNFEFTYKVELNANTNKNIKVWIPIPQSNEVQVISKLSIETELDYKIETEKQHGNTYFYAQIKNGLEQATDINIRFNVNRKQRGNARFKSTDPSQYLKANRLVPIGNRFDSIIEANKFTPENMRPVYDFVLNEMYYGKPKSQNQSDQYYASLPENIKTGITKDSVVSLYLETTKIAGEFTFGNGNSNYACDISVGNCTDFHSYFMSLARSMKIPSRFHIGFSIPEGQSGIIGGYHCWADFYQNNEWSPVDISEADNNPSKTDFYFGNLDANRVEFTQGRDLILEGYTKGPVNFLIYPIVESDGQTNTYTKSFSFKEI